MKKLKTWYRSIAVTLLTACLILIITNLALSGLSSMRHALRPDPGPIWKYGWQPVLLSYPGWEKRQIVSILNQTYYDRSIEYEPFTQFRERPRQETYVSVDSAGFRVVKNQGVWPPDPAHTNIFVFGGSTTFGYGVANGETIPSYLQNYASTGNFQKPVKVYNFGRGFYFSSQETALLYHFLVSNVIPDIAIFIDGLNDFVFLNGEPEYTRPLKSFMDGMQRPEFLVKAPIVRAAEFVRQRLLTSREPSEVHEPSLVDESSLRAAIDRWRRNKKITEAMASSFRVRTIFVWQPAPTYKYDIRYHPYLNGDFRRFGVHGRSRMGYTIMSQLRQTEGMGSNFLWLGDIQEKHNENLYVDLLHYRPGFAKEIASHILGFIRQQGLVGGSAASAAAK